LRTVSWTGARRFDMRFAWALALAWLLALLAGCATAPKEAAEPADPEFLAWAESSERAREYLAAKRFDLARDEVERAVVRAAALDFAPIAVLVTGEQIEALDARPRVGEQWITRQYLALFQSSTSVEDAYVRGALAMKLAMHHYLSMQSEDATRFNRTAVAALEGLPPAPRADLQPAAALLAGALGNLSLSLKQQGELAQAAEAAERSIHLLEDLLDSDDPRLLRTRAHLADVDAALENWERARELFGSALPELAEDPQSRLSLPVWRFSYARALAALGDEPAATATFKESMAALQAALNANRAATVVNLQAMTESALQGQRWSWAKNTLVVQLQLQRNARGGSNSYLRARLWIQLGMVDGILGQTAEAEQHYRRAFKILKTTRGPKSRELRGSGLMLYSRLLATAGRTLEANAAAEQAEALGAREAGIPDYLRPALGLPPLEAVAD
jgi:tetratricopeptide (TPR) repeat protein